jgi:hypothetical protein
VTPLRRSLFEHSQEVGIQLAQENEAVGKSASGEIWRNYEARTIRGGGALLGECGSELHGRIMRANYIRQRFAVA